MVDLMDATWTGGGPVNDLEGQGGLKKGELDALLLPWAKALMATRDETQEPHNACLPMGVPRVTPFLYGSCRTTRTSRRRTCSSCTRGTSTATGRSSWTAGSIRRSSTPWCGHSIGRFEKDTLVIDTVGYNDKFWFDRRGHPHTEQLHTIERWTRLSLGEMENKVTIDDPGAYPKPFTLTFMATTTPVMSCSVKSARKTTSPGFRPFPATKDVVWVPTPQALVDKMLDMAKVTPQDFVMDLGSGDGRTVITAAKRGARALGIEYNPDMVELSKTQRGRRAGVGQGDVPRRPTSSRPTLEGAGDHDVSAAVDQHEAAADDPGPEARARASSPTSFTMEDWQADETANR